MSFAVVLEGMTLIAYMVILAGGKQKREAGWGILSGLHVVCAALQCAGMAIIVSHLSVYSPGAEVMSAIRLWIYGASG